MERLLRIAELILIYGMHKDRGIFFVRIDS
jgi:hypothetical protein